MNYIVACVGVVIVATVYLTQMAPAQTTTQNPAQTTTQKSPPTTPKPAQTTHEPQSRTERCMDKEYKDAMACLNGLITDHNRERMRRAIRDY